MITHTIALDGDVLMATAPDGDDATMERRLNESLSEINAEDRDAVADRITYKTGLTLYESESDAYAADVEIVYSGTDMGWLEDENGETKYQAAGYPPAD